MAITLKANVRWGGVDYAPGATIPGLTPSDEAGLVSSNRAEWVGTPSTTGNAAVPVMATRGPGGGVELSAGGSAALPVLLQTRSIAFIGDSRARYGYETWYRTAAKVTDTAGFRVDLMGCGPSAPASGQGLVEWRASDRMLRWTAPSDTPGPWTPFVGAREYKLESGSVRQWLRARWTSAVAPAADASFAVAISGDGRCKTTISGTSSAVAAALNLHTTRPIYMGAGGAHTADCVEMLDWYAELASGPGIDVIRVGTNDITQVMRTIPDTIALAYTVFDARRKLGRKLVICGEGARWGVDASTPITQEQLDMLLALNQAYREYAIAHYGSCRYVDLFDVSHDPLYADARPKSGVLKDALHESDAGVALYAAAIAPAVHELGLTTDLPLTASDSMLGMTSMMLGNNGTIGTATTGVAPAGWRVRSLQADATVEASLVSAGDGRAGQRIQCAATAGAASATINVDLAATMAFSTYGIEIGDALEITADVEVVTGTLTSIEGMVFLYGSNRRGQVFFPVTVGARSIRCSVPVEIIPTDTSVLPQFYFLVPSGQSATFRLGNVCIRKAPTF